MPGDAPPPRASVLLSGLLLGLLTLAVFWPALGNGFVIIDDDVYVTANEHLQAGLSRAGLSWALTTTRADFWHPLAWLSLLADFQFHGLDPRGYHLTSILFHSASAAMLLVVLAGLTGSLWGALFGAAFFALHPLRVEAAAWVAARKEVLCAFFWMLALEAYLHFVRRPSRPRYGLVLLACVLSLLSKPMAITLPLALLLLDYWPLKRLSRGSVREKFPLFILSAAFGAVAVRAQSRNIAAFWPVPWSLRISGSLLACLAYLKSMLWPARLYPFHRLLGVDRGSLPSWAHVLAASLALGGISWLTLRHRRKHPCYLAGWLWYLITLFPTLGIIRFTPIFIADRYSYIPQIGLALVLAHIVAVLIERRSRRPLVALASVAAIAGCIALTREQIVFWRDSRALCERAVKLAPENSWTQNTLGVILAQGGEETEAMSHFAQALRLRPDYPLARSNLAVMLAGQGQDRRAAAQLEAAWRLRPDLNVCYNLAVVLARQNRLAEAERFGRMALAAAEPHRPYAYANLGDIQARLGRFENASAEYLAGLELAPGNAELHNNLGVLLAGRGRLKAAELDFREALALKPGLLLARHNLDLVLSPGRPAPATQFQFAEPLMLLTGL